MFCVPSCLEEGLTSVFFLGFGFEGEVFLLANFLVFLGPDDVGLATFGVGSKGTWEDCVGIYIVEVSKCFCKWIDPEVIRSNIC